MSRFRIFLIIPTVLVLYAGCQAVFTASPFSFLKKDVADMTYGQQQAYALDALASGDLEAMQEAYDALKDELSGSDDPEASLLGAHLAMELSGVPGILDDVVEGSIDFSGEQEDTEDQLTDFLAETDTEYMDDAADFYQSAAADGGELSGSDYILGATCILFSGTDGEDVDSASGTEEQADAIEFLEAGLADESLDEESRDMLQEYYDFISGI